MPKILSKNKSFNGESAGVQFRDGEGATQNPWLIQWFKEHGYTVEDEEKTGLAAMNIDELKAYAEEHNIDIGKSVSQQSILKKIVDAEKE